MAHGEDCKAMISGSKRSVVLLPIMTSLILAGCVWKSDYEALQAQNQQLQAQNQQLQTQTSADRAQIGRLRNAIKYTVDSDLMFAPGRWEMSTQGQQIIAKMASQLAPTQQAKLVITGYTDNAPIGPDLMRRGITSNMDLSQKRAESVMQYMVSQGVNPALVSAKGMGESDPVASNSTPQGRAKNRRVELALAGPAG